MPLFSGAAEEFPQRKTLVRLAGWEERQEKTPALERFSFQNRCLNLAAGFAAGNYETFISGSCEVCVLPNPFLNPWPDPE
jgi:hypothetical protein